MNPESKFIRNTTKHQLSDTFKDIFASFKAMNLAYQLAHEDLRDRFKRTLLGVVWLPISFLLFVLIKVLIFAKMNSSPPEEFFMYSALGFWVWMFVVGLVVDSANVFSRASGYIQSVKLPYPIYCLQMIIRNLVPYLLSLMVILLAYPLVSKNVHPIGYFWVVPATLLYVINGFWLALFLGTLSSRFRDLSHFVQTATRMLFFLTPVLWIPEQLGEIGKTVALYNPVSHFIAIVRDPIIYGTAPLISWTIAVAISLLGLILSFWVYSKLRSKLYFYV